MTRSNFSDPDAAILDVLELRDRYGMTDDQFRELHHRRNLGPSDGVAAHLRYLASVKTELRADHQRTAQRFHACLEALREGASWPAAASGAERRCPGARSK